MAYRWLGVLLLSAAFVIGCGSDGVGDPFGTGGTGGSIPECVTSLICRACPSEGFCSVDTDCNVGSVCIESGCDALVDGLPIKQCVFAGGGACTSSAMCPAGRECVQVPGERVRCVRTAPGCNTIFDCPPGFDCEIGSCVDRRVPCDLDAHCPKNHVCSGTTNSTFCVRVQRDCLFDFDCSDLAYHCADIDADGNKECTGTSDLNDPSAEACVNTMCTDESAPVCEVAAAGATTQCGQYGLCRDDNDCAGDFSCVGLWPDGRSECVPSGGTCGSFSDCPVRQACASPRVGDEPPSCQAGFQP